MRQPPRNPLPGLLGQVYKRDARQLVRAGLIGGKGVPESVAAHPCVFATFTAPSFGPVHARRMRGKTVLPCRPRRDADDRLCPHGRDISCPVRHAETDPRLGRPMCADCYDYEAAVLFNLHAADLWRRFTTYLPRHLARLAGVTGKRLRAELAHPLRQGRRIPGTRRHPLPRRDPPRRQHQRRVHAAPGPLRPPRCCATPSPWPPRPSASTVPGSGPHIRLRFGRELDTRPIWRQPFAATGRALDAAAVANYIAKYVTKAVDVPGLPDTRIRHASEIDALRCPAHHKRMVAMAWDLGARTSVGDPRLRLWAHSSASAATRSPNPAATPSPSATSAANASPPGGSSATPTANATRGTAPSMTRVVLVLANWIYAGTGYTNTSGAELALSSAAHAREHGAKPLPHDYQPAARRRITAMTAVGDRFTSADPQLLLTVEEAARRLNIGRTTMYALVSGGVVESVTIGRLRRVPSECLDNFVAALRSPNSPEITAA